MSWDLTEHCDHYSEKDLAKAGTELVNVDLTEDCNHYSDKELAEASTELVSVDCRSYWRLWSLFR